MAEAPRPNFTEVTSIYWENRPTKKFMKSVFPTDQLKKIVREMNKKAQISGKRLLILTHGGTVKKFCGRSIALNGSFSKVKIDRLSD